MKKRFWPIFSRFLECDKPQALKRKGPRGFPAFTVQVNRLLLGPNVSLQTNFSIHSCFHGDKRFWPVFRCTIESDKPQKNNLYGSTSYFDNYCGSFGTTSSGPKRLLEKKAVFPVKKTFWPNFLVASSITNIREQFISVQRVF